MIPEGLYRARATSCTFGETKNGNPQAVVEFQLLDEGPHEGTKISWYGFFTEKTTERTIKSLRIAGCTFPNEDITDLAGLGDSEVELDISHDTYNGNTRARVNWVNEIGGAPRVKAMEETSKISFAQRMKGAIVSIKANTPAPKTSPVRTPAPEGSGTEDDIPF